MNYQIQGTSAKPAESELVIVRRVVKDEKQSDRLDE